MCEELGSEPLLVQAAVHAAIVRSIPALSRTGAREKRRDSVGSTPPEIFHAECQPGTMRRPSIRSARLSSVRRSACDLARIFSDLNLLWNRGKMTI